MFSWDWFDGIPLISFIDGDECPQAIFFNVMDGVVFLYLLKVDVVSFSFSSWVFSSSGSSFYNAQESVILYSVNVCGLEP